MKTARRGADAFAVVARVCGAAVTVMESRQARIENAVHRRFMITLLKRFFIFSFLCVAETGIQSKGSPINTSIANINEK